jgi:hypothetical protein
MPAHVRLRGRVFINGAWLYEARGVREFRSQVNRPLGCARSRSRGATPHGADLHRLLALPAHVRLRGRVFINGAWLYEARGVRAFLITGHRSTGRSAALAAGVEEQHHTVRTCIGSSHCLSGPSASCLATHCS